MKNCLSFVGEMARGRLPWGLWTYDIVGSDKVLKGEGGSQSRVGGKRVGADDAQQSERVLGLGRLLLEGRLGWKGFVY